MRLIADTNLIIRALTHDDSSQFATATRILTQADAVVLTIVALCETVWTLRSGYHWRTSDIAAAIRILIEDPRADVDRNLAEKGLAMLDAGGDFADAVIAADGLRHEDAVFATFDKQAARLLEAQGFAVTLLG